MLKSNPTRALIFTNGRIEDVEGVRAIVQPEDFLVAADGGYGHMRRLGLRPHLLVGDLDSLAPIDLARLQAAGVRIARYPVDKNETDLELALQLVLNEGYRTLRIIGALGNRLDQTLGNIFLLTLPTLAECDVRLEDGHEEVFLIRKSAVVEGAAGDLISLLPLGGPAQKISTEGLRYPLKNETLFPERTRGISNELLNERAVIHMESGLLLCVHTRQTRLPLMVGGSK